MNILINTVGFISEIPGSDIAIRSPHNSTLYIGIFGGIIYFLLKTKLKYCGIFMIISSLILYSFEENPNIIFAPGIDTPCYIEDGKFYAPSKRKGWRKFISIQRNLGFSGELEKMELEDCLVERKKYENGLFIWSKNGKIIRKCQIAQRLHPYCPAFFEDLD
ncbi:hypothetical protein FACS1894113_0610 [Alphaproteobacteria bacterium]|nr:hypothetical protein FACS1894113_0610 [Alphaproteobacteria bacterium]